MTLFDFFQAEELPVPAITPARAGEIAREHFGVAAVITPLGSQQDANFLLSESDGAPIGVLKIANPAFSRIELEAQDAAAAYIAQAEAGVRTATNVEPAGYPPIAELRYRAGPVLFARIITHLGGGTMSGEHYLTPTRVAALGTLAGRTCRALADFEHRGRGPHPAVGPAPRQRTVEVLAQHVADTHRREAVEAAADAAWRVIGELADDLPVQVIHGDITDDNVVCSGLDSGRIPDGIIDFGDLTRSWPVAELAVAVSSLLRHEGGEPAATLPAVAAFHAVRPLSSAEIEALWPLVVLRVRGSGGQRDSSGRDRRRQRLRHRSTGLRVAHLRAGHRTADGRDDRADPALPGHRAPRRGFRRDGRRAGRRIRSGARRALGPVCGVGHDGRRGLAR